jgi:hypothetical protein
VLELETCIVFTPEPPRLYTLNVNAWLVLELCPDRTLLELERDYIAEVVPPLTAETARRQLHETVGVLERNGIVERVVPGAG